MNENEQMSSKHSLYIEIYNKIKEDIILGKYPPGTFLPPETELADNFYVSRITIRKAMQLLKKTDIFPARPDAALMSKIFRPNRNNTRSG